MRKLGFLAICAVLPAWGQFSSMSTDYAGQRLLFTTALSQAGSGQPAYGKMFVADSQGVRPLVIYNYEVYSSSFEGHPALVTNYYDAQGVDVSSNGMYISVLAQHVCQGYTGGLCGSEQQSTVYNAFGQTVLTTAGPVILSPGGTWALVPMQPLEEMPLCVLYNLTTGAFTGPLAGGVPQSCYDVADDGTVLISGGVSGLSILQNGLSTPISGATGQILAARIDSSAAVVVWEQLDASGSTSLHSVRTNNVMNPVSLGVSGQVDSQPQLSDDGATVLFLSTPAGTNDPQLFVMAPDGTGRHQAAAIPEGISQAVLSGNGEIAWAQTRTGRLVQVDLATGAITQYVASLAAFFNGVYAGPFSPGQSASLAASVMPGERVEVFVDGQRARILSLEQQAVVFQVPCTLAASPAVPLSIVKPDSAAWSGDTISMSVRPPSASTTPCEAPPKLGARRR